MILPVEAQRASSGGTYQLIGRARLSHLSVDRGRTRAGKTNRVAADRAIRAGRRVRRFRRGRSI
jgi:hypothetical protein